MKKTLLFALAAVATIFTSCSSDIINDNDDSNNGQGKGMTLIANVEQDDTRASLVPSDTYGSTWSFAYKDNDKVEVGNDQMDNKYYTFTKSVDNFSCADAKATNTAANWYAYYPSTTIDLTNQDGKADGSAAKLYALAGATETATTGADGLKINMKAQAAVLRIVKVDNYGPCDIYLKTADGKYVSGLKAKTNEAGYDVVKSDTKVSVFTKAKEGNAGIYYVIVPAGVKISVYNSDKLIKTTKDPGLKVGQYYTLTSGPTTGTATAKLLVDGTTKTEKVDWVQLWIGGPRFAVKNVDKQMSWYEATKTGDEYVWGANWRTPAKEELAILDPDDGNHIPTIVDIAASTDNGVQHFKYTGTQPGYKTNNMILPYIGNRGVGTYWTSTKGHVNKDNQETGVNYNITDSWGPCMNYFVEHERHILYVVRPVLTIQTVKWGEQNIQ